MEATVLIDELHVTVRVPVGLPETDINAVRRTLAADEFTAKLRQAVRDVAEAFPDLVFAQVSLTR